MMTATTFFHIAKFAYKLGDHNGVHLTGEDVSCLPRKGGRFKIKGGLLVIKPIETQYGRGYVNPCGGSVRVLGNKVIVSHWETEE